jgi:cyclophilin family peptidyl-prolyl cis-trans isomerase
VPTEKRQRQKAGRQARLAVQEKARKRRRNLRRVISIVVVAAIVVGISYWIAGGHHSTKSTSTTTTNAKTSTSTTSAAPAGGSGNKSLSAITTSADCPASFSATLNKPSWPSAPKMTIDQSKTYTVTVTTDIGPFTIQLDPKTAPIAVNSFVFLAQQHFFDCVIFHRVIPSFVDQTGDPTGTGTGGPGYQFAEPGPKTASPQYPLGSVAMANSNNPATTDPTTNGSQFFIVAGSQGESLAPNYTLFGQVTSGMAVIDKINQAGASSGTPTTPHRMVSVTVTES